MKVIKARWPLAADNNESPLTDTRNQTDEPKRYIADSSGGDGARGPKYKEEDIGSLCG